MQVILLVHLLNLPITLHGNIQHINTRIHDNVHIIRAKHDFAKRGIRHDNNLLIQRIT